MKNRSTRGDRPPTLTAEQAIPLIQRQIDRLDEVSRLERNDPQADAWLSTTINICNAAFGLPGGEMHENTSAIRYARSGLPLGPDTNWQEDYRLTQNKRRALLAAYIEQLRDLVPNAVLSHTQYLFHSDVERVSGRLFRDGHFKQAALDAYIRVLDKLKEVTNLPEDGDRLVNRALGCENREPLVRVNELRTEPEKDEQKGIMFLFKGIVGLRNSKAHSNRLFNDPFRAFEYLALASLLIRLLESQFLNHG